MKEGAHSSLPESTGALFNQYLDTVWELAKIENKTEKSDADRERRKFLEYGLYVCSKRLISELGLPLYLSMLKIASEEMARWNAEPESEPAPPVENENDETMIKKKIGRAHV